MDCETLQYVVNHIFLPIRLPEKDDYDNARDLAICDVVIEKAKEFAILLGPDFSSRWKPVVKMLRVLRSLQSSVALDEKEVARAMQKLKAGNVLVLPIRAQNACVILRKDEETTTYESFEVDPPNAEIMGTVGRLVCSFPGPVVTIPDDIALEPSFQTELASFLAKMDVDVLDSAPTTVKARSTVPEARDTADPHYITQLLTAILRGLPGSETPDVQRIDKHIRNDIIWHKSYKPWRRSALWLIIRVALQTTSRSQMRFKKGTDDGVYKTFMVFLMAEVMRLDECSDFPADLLHCMRAKVGRRLHKIQGEVPTIVGKRVLSAIHKITALLNDRWTYIQNGRTVTWSPDDLNIASDLELSLFQSKEYIAQRLSEARLPRRKNISKFSPSQHPRLVDEEVFDPDDLSDALSNDPCVALIDMEEAVQQHLDAWVEAHYHDSAACMSLARCIKIYCKTAREWYGNPEDRSMMLLTIFQLWVALDKLAIADHPLLSQYSPEIPMELLQPLLVRRASSIERFIFLQQYISERHERAHRGSVFEDEVTAASFAVESFDQSPELQALKTRIEAEAHRERDAKCKELELAERKYVSLLEQAGSHDHQYREKRHAWQCIKCRLEKEAENMRIRVHEWPLPKAENSAKAVVFELTCPVVFQTWRTTTYEILHDVCRSNNRRSPSPADPEDQLGSYTALLPYVGIVSRVTYGSSTKPFARSHYSALRVSEADVSTICVNNGLTFRLYDGTNDVWISDSLSDLKVADFCTFEISANSPYRTLQYAVSGTMHTSNTVIARQCNVPSEITLHEYYEFCTLRSGPRLQWLNILRELRARTMSFSRPEVQLLVMQAAFQAGPVDENGLEWHTILRDPAFGMGLLVEMNDFVDSIEDNWAHVITLQTLILLTTRLLASNEVEEVVAYALSLLRRARRVAFRWLHQVITSLRETDSGPGVADLQCRVCTMAATCRATYDVDSEYLDDLLASDEDVMVYVQCSICLHDNVPLLDLPSDLKRLLSRDRRLALLAMPVLWTKIEESQIGLDNAIAAIWMGYQRGSLWERRSEPNDRWVTTRTVVDPVTGAHSRVYLNLFDGTLLINGKPLGRLPSDIVKSETYIRVLGQNILDIIPSDLPSMDFATRGDISTSGFQLHFKLQPDNDLIIQARKGSDIYELIPHHRLADDFPTFLTERYAHWLCISPGQADMTNAVEFRPMDSRWIPSKENWRIDFNPSGISHMCQGNAWFLVDIRSPTFKMVSSVLAPLELSRYLHVTSTGNSNLSVELPRSKLSFYLNGSQELESNNMRKMVIDTDSPSGTMVGLSSQLVLKSIKPAMKDLPRTRCVIIPFGDIVCQPTRYHVDLHVDLGNSSSVRYFRYDIDTTLGCLVGTTLLSDLYKILLHASTSFPLPDPLTGRTGTEEALADLGSAKCLSFQTLEADDYDLLSKIATLAPEREWYPEHLQVMQTVHWRKFGPFAQHWGYNVHVRTILRYHAELSIFDNDEKPWMDAAHDIISSDEHLRDRAASRNFHLYPPEFAIHEPSPDQDRPYPPLGGFTYRRSGARIQSSTTKTAADVSAMVQRWPRWLDTVPDLWTRMHDFDGPLNPGAQISISYQKDLLHPTLSDIWIPFYNQCRNGTEVARKFALTFSLSAMVYGSPEHLQLIPTMIAFATVPQFSTIDPPLSTGRYDLSLGSAPDKTVLYQDIAHYALPLDETPSYELDPVPRESPTAFEKRRESHWRAAFKPEVEEIVENMCSQWPCKKPNFPSNAEYPLIDVESKDLRYKVVCLLHDWHRNWRLYQHVQQVQAVLDSVRRSSTPMPSSVVPEHNMTHSPILGERHQMPSLEKLLSLRDPSDVIPPPIPEPLRPVLEESQGYRTSKLKVLLNEFSLSRYILHRRYGSALDSSRQSFKEKQNHLVASGDMTFSVKELRAHHRSCYNYAKTLLQSIKDGLIPTGRNGIEQCVHLSGQLPRITTRSLLDLLSGSAKRQLPEDWKDIVVLFAQSLVRLQHAERLVIYAKSRYAEEFTKELSNDRFEEDSAFYAYPEWLLIQIEGNFLVRPLQSRMAEEMMTPSSNENTVLQLNMGEGKSSVIVPLISSQLADGETLVRVVVLKPLAHQMFQLLVLRLSGLANRRIFYFPFSRDVEITPARARQLQSLYEACMRERGILVVQPEHILSFKLMGIDLAVSGREDEAAVETLLESQRWLTSRSRDILDESDEILSVNYQLVYTSGLQAPMEGHPDRWLTIQEIMSATKRHAHRLHDKYPTGLEVEMVETSSFPVIRVLEKNAGDELIHAIAQDLINKERFRLLRDSLRQAVFKFITFRDDAEVDSNKLESQCKDTNLWKCLLLCRGLLGSGGILQFVLQQKRWRVDYGLDPTRTLLAVPYRAKDVPSLRADFGHPDVTIALTCLSYYYGGLTAKELDLCFELLFKLDNPALEYEAWVADHEAVPESLRQIIGVNSNDSDQRKNHLFPLFHRNHSVVNFYLSNVVFPREAKQFPKKLATSAWDLAETKCLPTTGFSGTNDNCDLLPTSIEQRDPLDQLSTNAKVLTYLLQPENDHYVCLQRDEQPLTSRDFLELMVEQIPPVRVLLDVGAQMLDLRNTELARTWLSLDSDLDAVLFFDDADHLVVMSSDQTIEPFISSQYNQKLDLCGVYLDDAHTRGTDLKFPVGFRAAVTLGPKLTKDRLVQGCMRMRKLGHGHSVMFFAPVEVDRSICGLRSPGGVGKVRSLDILRWVMSETCNYIDYHLSHWAQQGVEYKKRNDAWATYDSNPSAVGAISKLRASWEEVDARSLLEMYSPVPQENTFIHPAFMDLELNKRLRLLGFSSLVDAKIDEEQEREVSHEAEFERQIQRPPKAEQVLHKLYKDVVSFVTTGTMPTNSSAFVPLFSPLSHLGTHAWSASLWATKDFSATVEGPKESATDYLRPVHWVLSVSGQPLLVVLSPYEVNKLLPRISESQHVHLHIYAPRVTKAMKTFEGLDFFCIPPLQSSWTPPSPTGISQLNLWAGQLYIQDFDTYSRVCLMLGLVRDTQREARRWESDGFALPEHRRSKMATICKFTTSPLPFLKELIGLRRKGMNYMSTHMGRILNAGLLTEEDFEF